MKALRALVLVFFVFGCSDDSLDALPNEPAPTVSQEEPPSTECQETTLLALRPELGMTSSLLLVVDRSGSMNEQTRWNDMKSSLTTITQELDDVISFGLMLFPAVGLNSCGTGAVQVDPAIGTSQAILNAMETASPLGGTPTALSLKAAGEYLIERNPDGPNYLLLATDGWPGCNNSLDSSTCLCPPEANCGFGSQNCLDDIRTASTVLQLREAGVFTYVIGIPGTEEITDLLNSMAIAGGTAIDGQHYQVGGSEELTDALRSIAGSLIPCIYDLNEEVQTPQWLEVRIDGSEIQRDPNRENGWELLGRDRLGFFGEICDGIRDGEVHQIEAFIACDE